MNQFYTSLAIFNKKYIPLRQQSYNQYKNIATLKSCLMSQKCPQCHNEIPNYAKYCPICGSALTNVSRIRHNIICLEAEWEFNDNGKNRFSLNTEPMLRWLQESIGCGYIFRRVLTPEDFFYYINQFVRHTKDIGNNYDIVYISSHGKESAISFESLDGESPGIIPFKDLVTHSNGFFKDKIVHFDCCETLKNGDAVLNFKNKSGAKLVSGYTTCVDAYKSAIADIAYFSELVSYKNVGIFKNKKNNFWRSYESLLDELGFEAY